VKDVKPLRYVARQPIVDREARVFGYELLFRDGLENAFNGAGDEAVAGNAGPVAVDVTGCVVRRAACRSLKEAGYTIALDDYVAHDRRVALEQIADIIKVEMHLTVAGGENRNAGRICDGAGSGGCTFQGYFPGIRRR